MSSANSQKLTYLKCANADGLPKPYYDHDGITIFNADCRDVLPNLTKVDLVLTDPPYGIGEAAGKNRTRGKAAIATDYGNLDWDNETPSSDLIDLVVSAGRHAVIFGGNYFHLPPSSCWLVWDKDNTGDFADCELAWTNFPKAVRRLRYRWNGMLQEYAGKHKESRFHPTQKPEGVIAWALGQASPEPKSVLDPFMGSGTTLRVCKDRGIRCVGIDREERYCEIAANRLAQECLPFEEVNQ